jgi:Tfp pilus assembly protein PilF
MTVTVSEWWSYVGPLVGLAVGTVLQSWAQRKQWRRDNIKQECREVIIAITTFRFALYAAHHPDQPDSLEDEGTRNRLNNTFTQTSFELQQALATRILIDKRIKRLKVAQRLDDAQNVFKAEYYKDRKRAHDGLRDALLKIQEEITAIAIEA